LIAWGQFYEAAGAANFTPMDVNAMSLWQYNFTMSGFRKFHSSASEGPGAPTEDEFERMMSLYGAPSQSIRADA
jgi:hypothetical protein